MTVVELDKVRCFMLLAFNRFLKTIAGAAVVLCIVFERANADRWIPFANLRAVNVAGPYYVTVTLDRHYTIKAQCADATR